MFARSTFKWQNYNCSEGCKNSKQLLYNLIFHVHVAEHQWDLPSCSKNTTDLKSKNYKYYCNETWYWQVFKNLWKIINKFNQYFNEHTIEMLVIFNTMYVLKIHVCFYGKKERKCYTLLTLKSSHIYCTWERESDFPKLQSLYCSGIMKMVPQRKFRICIYCYFTFSGRN